MNTPFFLSHHPASQYQRCVRVAGLHLCARCLGLYPVMFAMIAAQIALKAPLSWPYDTSVALLLPAPTMLDWARGRFDPLAGSNFSRVTTGILLGISLGRTLYLHLVNPGFPLSMAQLGAIGAIAVVVEAAVWWRRRRTDPNEPPDVPTDSRDGSEP
ncbi:MAG TPA: DUF2085 domain-containing protein [Myxococcales bacterium]|jgi:uncharacterized membrane protein